MTRLRSIVTNPIGRKYRIRRERKTRCHGGKRFFQLFFIVLYTDVLSNFFPGFWLLFRNFNPWTEVHCWSFSALDWEILLDCHGCNGFGKKIMVEGLIAIISALYFQYELMIPIYEKYQESKTITSIKTTNYPVWNINFPGVTICSNNKVSKSRSC